MDMEVDATSGDDERFDSEIAQSEWEGVRQSFVRSQVGVIGDEDAAIGGKVRVKDLSRLWHYRNGMSPDDGVRRASTT